MVSVPAPRRVSEAGAERCEVTDVRENVRERADDPLDNELLVLVRRSSVDVCRGLCHDVGGSERGVLGRTPNSSMRVLDMCSPYDRVTELRLRSDVDDEARFLSDCEDS